MLSLTIQHQRFCAAGTLPFLAADFFDFRPLRGDETVFLFFNFVEQEPPGDETVQRQSYIVAPEQAESMEAWTQEAKTILAEKSGAPNPDLKPSC